MKYLNFTRILPNKEGLKVKMSIDSEVSKEHEKSHISFENNKKWKNWQGTALIDEIGKDNTFIGRNYCYKPIIIKGDYNLGDEVNVKVNNITIWDLRT